MGEGAKVMGTTAAAIDKRRTVDFVSDDTRRRELCAVVSRHLPSFHRKALYHLGNAADAEDAVQDALLSAFRHLGQFRGHAQMSTWLMRIVINSARGQLRKRSRATHVPLDEPPQVGEAYPLLELLPDREPSPEETCRRSNLAAHVAELAQRLPPNLQSAFQLRDLHGMTIREMTKTLGVTEGTVKARISRARAKLRWLAR